MEEDDGSDGPEGFPDEPDAGTGWFGVNVPETGGRPDPALEGVRDQLAQAAEKAAEKANWHIDRDGFANAGTWLTVVQKALTARRLTELNPYLFDQYEGDGPREG